MSRQVLLGTAPQIEAHPVVSIMDWIPEPQPAAAPRETRLCRDCATRFQAHPDSERRTCDRCIKRNRKKAGYD